ncbi:MAG: hypothetical protein J6W84_03355 [Bacteroidales bacterium]|nr:hypothetical protein [Bacteroidales bacterium]
MTEGHRNRNKRHYLKKVSEHKCVTCGKQDERTLAGMRYCQECRDRHRANASPKKKRTPEQRKRENDDKRAWYAMCVEKMMCVQCGRKDKHTVNGHRYCAICQEKKNKRNREKWDSEEKAAYHKNRRDKWREQGLCTCCGGKKEEPDRMMCIDCRVKAKMNRLRRQAEKGGAKGFGKGKYS